MTERLIRLKRARKTQNDALGSCPVRLRAFIILRPPAQLRTRGVETPCHGGNVESLEEGQPLLDVRLGTFPVLLGNRDPRLHVPAERVQVGFGGREGRREKAVGVTAGPT